MYTPVTIRESLENSEQKSGMRRFWRRLEWRPSWFSELLDSSDCAIIRAWAVLWESRRHSEGNWRYSLIKWIKEEEKEKLNGYFVLSDYRSKDILALMSDSRVP